MPLHEDPLFGLVSNGAASIDADPENLLPYRYLLSDTLDTQKLDAAFLREQLGERIQDLSSPAGSVLEPLIPRDPDAGSAEARRSLAARAPAAEALRRVVRQRGQARILVVATKAAAFDPDRAGEVARALQKHFEETRGEHTCNSPSVALARSPC